MPLADDTLPFLSWSDPLAPALCDPTRNGWMNYGDVRQKITETLPCFAGRERGLVLCFLPSSVSGALAYLAAAQAGMAIALADPQTPNKEPIIAAYEPDWIIASEGWQHAAYEAVTWPISELSLFVRKNQTCGALHPDFYLMLLTSGSTGSSKGVRLSHANIASNTRAIIQSLSLSSDQTALCHLPLAYSFGLSILHMQLAVGGKCFLTQDGLMSGDLWRQAREHQATLFAGVPYHYEMLMRLGLARLNVPSLKTFLQAGGKMQAALTQKVLSVVRQRNGELFIMYGQTEASPRISCFPLHRFEEKLGSSGKVLQGGRLSIEDGEIVYRGPNVMMGYATSRADLARGDETHGELRTGDLGSLDPDGFLTITGRRQRFAKLFGQRVSLDDLEKIASAHASCIAVEQPEKIVLLCLQADEAAQKAVHDSVIAQTKLPAPWVTVRSVEAWPTKSNGKVDYPALQKEFGGA